jgi:hypothetical protein
MSIENEAEALRHQRYKKTKVGYFNLDDYWIAPSGLGEKEYEWRDKPHRLVYDLIGEIDRLHSELEKIGESKR